MRRSSNGVHWLAIFAVFVVDGYSDASEPPLAPIKSPADQQPITTAALPPMTAPAAVEAQTKFDQKSPTAAEMLDVSVPAVIERVQHWPPEVPWDRLPASYQRILKALVRPAATQKRRKLGDRRRFAIWDLSLAETIHLALINNNMLRVDWDLRTAESLLLAVGNVPPTVFDPMFQDFGELLGKRGLAVALSAFDSQKLFPPCTSNAPLQYPQSLEEWSWTEVTRVAGRINAQFGGVSGCRGVVISRNNTDVSVTDFEWNLTNTLRDVEKTYWDLYLAYRSYDINVEARNSFLRTWRFAQANQEAGRFGDLDELQSRQAYFQGRADCQDALQNLYNLETQLRRLCALPSDDGRIIRTRDDPSTVEYIPDWNLCLAVAWTRREELRREKWYIKSLEMRLRVANAAPPQALSDETQLSKAREELANNERQVCDELRTTFQNLSSRFQATQSNYNRWQTAAAQIDGCENRYRTGVPGIDTSVLLQQWLTTRSDAATAEVKFYSSLVEYQKSLTDLHFRKGTLLELNDVHLAESSWTLDACNDALHRAFVRSYGLDFSIDVRVHPKPEAIDRNGMISDIDLIDSGQPALSDPNDPERRFGRSSDFSESP